MGKTFEYGREKLTVGKALEIARAERSGYINEDAQRAIRLSSEHVKTIAEGDRAVYGINTGFGPLCTTRITPDDLIKLQTNILMSHAVGVGDPLGDELVKLMIILKIHALAQGYSGVQLDTLLRMIWMVEEGVLPVVPSQGSVGASGDLAPLAHLFLPLIGMGLVRHKGKIRKASEVLIMFNLSPIALSPKEGLALINGTQFIAAHSVQLVEKLHNLIMAANITGAMMIEGLKASVKPFQQKLHTLRPYPGNQFVAAMVDRLLKDSAIVASHAGCARVQDPYSLRCIPQVHGASLTSWLHLRESVEIELNSVTDNPIIFDKDDTISGGNFHGQPLALPIDYACLAAAEIGNISDRRIYLSLEGDTPGVPKLLMKETGTNSGFMIVQYTAAALASENKGLCFPASADSIPTSLGQEDHVSMGSIGARKALKVVQNAEKILAIELICAAQALDYHHELKSGKIMEAVHAFVREKIPHIEADQLMSDMIGTATDIIQSGDFVKAYGQVMQVEQLGYDLPHSEQFENY